MAKLTKAQIQRLGRRLAGTSANVYLVVKLMFNGHQADDTIFTRLEKEFGIFRCVQCSMWLDVRDREGDFCTSCTDEADEED